MLPGYHPRTVVGVKAVVGVRVYHYLGARDAFFQLVLHALDPVERNPRIEPAVKAYHGHFQTFRIVDRCFRLRFGRGRSCRCRNPPVPSRRGIDPGVMRGVHPGYPAAPAKTRDRELFRVSGTRASGPRHARIEIRHRLRVGYFREYIPVQFARILYRGDLALPGIERRGDGHVTELGKPPETSCIHS